MIALNQIFLFLKKPIQWFRISCSLYSTPIYASSWEDVISFLSECGEVECSIEYCTEPADGEMICKKRTFSTDSGVIKFVRK